MKSKITKYILVVLLTFTILFMISYKPPINTITTEELDKIYGVKVGGVIIERIQLFIADNPNAKVDDLRQIKGVDDMIIDQLKGRFR